LDGPVVTEPGRTVAGRDAAAFIAATVAAHPPRSVWLVATGPLTNVALALRHDPALADRLAGLSFMGGAARGGNVTPAAEFNIWADPEAAAEVLAAGVSPTVMSGLDVTLRLDLDDGVVERLRRRPDHAASVFCADLLATYLDRQQAATGHRHGPAHDVCAVLAVTHPHLLVTRPCAVAVELDGTLTRGMTVVDERRTDRGRPPNVEVGVDLDAAGAVDVVLDAVDRTGGPGRL
jgi:inosine-uridine nucleoside N-ribohydrolase